MDDWQRERDRDLWRAAQYSHIYGQEYAQNYLMWARALPGLFWAVLIVIGICAAFPPVLLFAVVGLLLWGASAAFHGIRAARQAEAKRQAQRASIERHQAAVDRLLHDLKVSLADGNDAAVGEVCKSLAREDAFGATVPLLRIALGDIDPCQRLCAVRGLRWGTRFMDQVKTPDGGFQIVVENMPNVLLFRTFLDSHEITQNRVAAAIALGNGGYMDGIRLHEHAIHDPIPEVRAACCHAMGKLMALGRGNAESRSIWVGMIPENDRLEAFGALVTALRDPNPRARQEAAQALGEFRDPRALRPLQELAADSSQPESVRRAASDAVATLRQGVSV